jgi:uroporphyrinogen decarboxylase
MLFAPETIIRTQVYEILNQVRKRPHIMNLGHGVLPGTPVQGVQAFVKAVRNLL